MSRPVEGQAHTATVNFWISKATFLPAKQTGGLFRKKALIFEMRITQCSFPKCSHQASSVHWIKKVFFQNSCILWGFVIDLLVTSCAWPITPSSVEQLSHNKRFHHVWICRASQPHYLKCSQPALIQFSSKRERKVYKKLQFNTRVSDFALGRKSWYPIVAGCLIEGN